jgi:Pectate lyase superfamily protein
MQYRDLWFYRSAIESNGQVIPGQSITEYTSEPPRQVVVSADQHSLNLPVEETPDVPWDAEGNFAQWVNVAAFGARPTDDRDDADAVQRAVDAANRTGKTTVYFPYGEYYLSKIIRVWGSVRRLIGMTAILTITDPLMSAKGPLFRLEPGQDVVVFERMYARPKNRSNDFEFIRHAAPNTVVFKHGRGGIYRNVVTGGRAFFEDWTSYLRLTGPQQVWVRQ